VRVRSRRKTRIFYKTEKFLFVVLGLAGSVIGACLIGEALGFYYSEVGNATHLQNRVNQRCGTNFSLVDLATRWREIAILCR